MIRPGTKICVSIEPVSPFFELYFNPIWTVFICHYTRVAIYISILRHLLFSTDLEQVFRILVALSRKPLAQVKAGMLDLGKPFSTLEMSAPSVGHSHRNDFGTAHGALVTNAPTLLFV
jgi:hypothetical protein